MVISSYLPEILQLSDRILVCQQGRIVEEFERAQGRRRDDHVRGGALMERAPQETTRPVTPVRTIEDIVAIESHPYDELVTARNLYDLFWRPRSGRRCKGADGAAERESRDVGASFTHRALLRESRGRQHVPCAGHDAKRRGRGLPGANAA
jgi:ABC-type dipeptide/oligopeptide/nickel transport system ATPase component